MAIGMPAPRHPFDLWVAFTFVSFAFLGLGLVMAMMADNVPAVQALGQCIFLPMLIIGGVAVPLASLPDWAQHVSAFFPGRYAVEALQVSVTGDGLGAARFNLLALVLIGASGCVAAGRLFRWDAQQRFAARGGKAWLAVAFAGWAAVGLLAESRGRIGAGPRVPTAEQAAAPAAPGSPAASNAGAPATAPPPVTTPSAVSAPPEASTPPAAATAPAGPAPSTATAPPAATGKPAPSPPEAAAKQPEPPPATEPRTASPEKPVATEPGGLASWQAVTPADIERDLVFDRLPSDKGVVTPIADADEEPDPEVVEELEFVREALPKWAPGKVSDPVQRVRNYLYVAAVPDVFQIPIERFIAQVVFDRLQEDVPKDQLIQILYWIALHPNGGDDAALDQMWALRLGNGPSDTDQVRERAAFYAVKLLGRLTGKIVPR